MLRSARRPTTRLKSRETCRLAIWLCGGPPTKSGKATRLSPGKSALHQRKRSNALARDSENGIANRRYKRRQSRLAQPRWSIFGPYEMNLHGRSVPYAKQLMLIEIALHDPPILKRNLLEHHLAKAIYHRALHLRFSAAWIDNLTADVAANPDLVDRNGLAGNNRHFGNVGEVSLKTVVKRHPQRRAFGQSSLAPAGLFSDIPQHCLHPLRIVRRLLSPGARRAGLVLHFGFGGGLHHALSWFGKQVQTELHGVFAGGVRQFVEEGLHDETLRVGARRTQRTGLQADRKSVVWGK